MGQIDSGSKSNRLLASRRYTHNTFNTAQESFTNVLDLRSEEIYTRAHPQVYHIVEVHKEVKYSAKMVKVLQNIGIDKN